MNSAYDLVIIGSGFGGSLLSMVAHRLGLSVLLLERGTHPRFVIGESTSPLANLLLEEIARRYDLPRLLPLTSYGAWQRTYPEIICGLKRGFTYFHHEAGTPYRAAQDRSRQLMVAASPCDEVADTHWLRADVDHFLVQEAVALGVDYRDQVSLGAVTWARDGSAVLQGERQGRALRVHARLVVDATGPRGFLSQTLNLPQAPFADFPQTQTLYSHFSGVRRCDEMDEFQTEETPPYPLDDAALHHIFEGGWMWVLRFGNGVTSAGIAVTDALAQELELAEGAPAWRRFLRRFPSIQKQFEAAEPVQPFFYAPRLAYRCSVAAGPGWVLLPSAAAFVDPLFSTGIPLTLLGIERLGRILEDGCLHPALDSRLREYGEITLSEADGVARFIGACYAAFPCFSHFPAFSMFYFAAASYSEIARRIGRGDLVRRFLAADHPVFAEGLQRCADHLMRDEGGKPDAFGQEVARYIADLNIAGLCDPEKRNWYGVDLEDVIQGAQKLGQTPLRMRQLVETAAWAKGCCPRA